eukprot:2007541-Karenia_brevis.AAC.1
MVCIAGGTWVQVWIGWWVVDWVTDTELTEDPSGPNGVMSLFCFWVADRVYGGSGRGLLADIGVITIHARTQTLLIPISPNGPFGAFILCRGRNHEGWRAMHIIIIITVIIVMTSSLSLSSLSPS